MLERSYLCHTFIRKQLSFGIVSIKANRTEAHTKTRRDSNQVATDLKVEFNAADPASAITSSKPGVSAA